MCVCVERRGEGKREGEREREIDRDPMGLRVAIVSPLSVCISGEDPDVHECRTAAVADISAWLCWGSGSGCGRSLQLLGPTVHHHHHPPPSMPQSELPRLLSIGLLLYHGTPDCRRIGYFRHICFAWCVCVYGGGGGGGGDSSLWSQ